MKNTKKDVAVKASSQRELDELEKKIPGLARMATQEARTNALKRGYSLIEAKAGTLYKTSPRRKRTEIKKIEPNRRMTSSRTLHLKLK